MKVMDHQCLNIRRSISNSFQSLLMIYQPSYSCQTNQHYLELPENQTPDGLIQEIEMPSSFEERVVDNTSMHADMYAPCDFATASACVETSDVDSHMYSLSDFTANASCDPQPAYSYQTNQLFLELPENQTPDGLIQEIEMPSSFEERVVDNTSMHADMYVPCDSTTASACVTMSDTNSHVYSLSVFTSNASHDSYQVKLDSNNLAVAIENNDASPTSVTIRVFHPSEVPRWEVQLSQLSEWLAYSPMTLSGHEYLSMSMIQIPKILTSLNSYALTQVSLMWSFAKTKYEISFPSHKMNHTSRGRRRLHILREDIGVVTEFIVCPLDKTERQYVAVDKANLVQRQCNNCGHSKVTPSHVFYGYYIHTRYNLEPAILHCNSHQLFEGHAKVELELARAKCIAVNESGGPKKKNGKHTAPRTATGRPGEPNYMGKLKDSGAVQESVGRSSRRVKKDEEDEGLLQAFQQSGDETKYPNNLKNRVAVQESHMGPSELELPKEWNAFNTRFKNTRLNSIQVLCLKSREVTIGERHRQPSSNQQNQRNSSDSHQQIPTHPASSRACAAPHIHAAAHTSTGSCMRPRERVHDGRENMEYSNVQDESQSHMRGDEAFVEEIRTVDLPYSAQEITQLLHASHYDEIIQQLRGFSSNPRLPPESVIPTHFIVGVAYFKTSKYKEAKMHFNTSAALAEEEHRDGDVMLCNAYLGDIEYASRSYLEATKYYKKAVKHYTSGSVALMFKLIPPSISAIHAKLASAFRNVSMMVQAIQHYQTAISEAKTDRDQLSAHTSLGNLYQSMGDNSNALSEYKESIKLAEVLSDHVSLGWAHGNIGNAYLGLNKKDEALHNLQKSLDLAVEYEKNPQAIGRTYNNLGTAYQSMNDLDKAEEYYDLALSQAIYGDDIAGQARVCGNIGNVHMLRKKYERAILRYSEVLHLSTDPSTISTARHNRGCAYYDWATSFQQNHGKDGALKIHGPECDVDICLSNLSSKAIALYRKGINDLEEVVKYHEERLQHVKGSASGLTLSVSLFESSSRTFHRLQDCLFNVHLFERALLVAEQSRARTLGELLLKRKGIDMRPPLKFDQITGIVKSLQSPLIYFSYTGARLICWIFLPNSGQPTMYTFDRPLTGDQFDGKSFDYHLRYGLTEKLVERSFEIYQRINYDSESSIEVRKLYNLIGEPIQNVLLGHSITGSGFLQLTNISDSYTALLPLTCLQDPKSTSFFGDHYYFNSVPSLLTLGIMNQSADISVDLKDAENDFCIVGDPNIPPFRYNDDLWYLGKLPYAKREAEWIAHTLQTTPVLNEHATKSAFLSRLRRAKVVHIATHGSASAGFLAFAAFAIHNNDSRNNTIDGSSVLLFPAEVERLSISPALVVLSSCDSGRGTVKADGIQGMARAFILAGAQSVLTTLWKVPDESASVFMQFFYQYLNEGIQSSLALQKAILSVRCFTKYSQYIHWSGYQLTGRNIHFSNTPKPLSMIIQNRLGKPSVFPRLSDVKKLKKLIKDPTRPTDVQILKGCASVNPSEVVKDFILSSYTHFSGGIFWINCHQPEMILSSIEYIQKVIGTDLIINESRQVLFVFEGMTQLPTEESLLRILGNDHVHIIAVYSSCASLDKLIREIDRKLVRGCAVHNIEPLTMVHTTQRMVFSVIENFDLAPTNADQRVFEKLAELTLGSPLIIDMAVQALLDCLNSKKNEGVQYLGQLLQMEGSQAEKSDTSESKPMCDLFYSMKKLITCCMLSREEQLLLNSLAAYAGSPVPLSLVTEMSCLITRASHQPHLTGTLHQKLISHKLLLQHPSPVIIHPVLQKSMPKYPEFKLVYIPQDTAQYLWEDMEPIDKAFALSIAYHAMYQLVTDSSAAKSDFVGGACSLLNEKFEVNYKFVGKECYQQVFHLFLLCDFSSPLILDGCQPNHESTDSFNYNDAEQICGTKDSSSLLQQPDAFSEQVSFKQTVQPCSMQENPTESHAIVGCRIQSNLGSTASLVSHQPQLETEDFKQKADDLQEVNHSFVELIKWEDNNGVIKELRIYSNIAYNWKKIATLLGFELGEIESVHADYHTSYCCITAVLRRWFENAKNLPNASKYPKSWQGLMKLLNDAQFGEVANDLIKALSSPWNSVRRSSIPFN